MIDSIHAFLEEKYERLNGGEATKEEIREMVNELLEMAKSDERSFYSYYVVLIKHMLKYVYQKERQTGSWIKSIRNSHSELFYMVDDKAMMKKISLKLPEMYKKARREAAGETHLSLSAFPEECPEEWTVENLTDYDFIDKFLKDNVYSVYAKDYLGI